MANGNQGSDFNKFLSTLFSASQANERLKVQKDSLALQEMSTMSQSNYRDYLMESSKADARRQDFELEATALAPYPELQKDWLKNQPFIKKNPEYGARIDATFKARTELDDRIYAAAAMPPGPRLEEYRKIRLDKNLNKTQIGYIDTAIKGAMEEGSLTLEEMKMQPAYSDLLAAQAEFKAISKGGRARDPKNTLEYIETEDEFQGRRQDALDRMFSFEKQAREQERAGRGVYPGLSIPFYEKYDFNVPMYDNIEDISDEEVDEVLKDIGATVEENKVLPPEFAPPERPTTPPQTYTEDSLGVPADVEAVAPEDATLLTPAYDFSGFSSEDMKKYGTQIFFDKDTNRWYDLQTMEPATISQIKRHQGKDKPKKLSANQKNNINRIVKQMAQLKTRTYDKKILEGKINRLKNKILNIDPNYKFKD